MNTESSSPPEERKGPKPAICPECGTGNLRVTGFQANSERPIHQMGQSSVYAQGQDNPTVTVECTNADCSYMAERPGGPQMVRFLYPEP